MTQLSNDWPGDADGDVFRRLVEHGFDFSKAYSVDFNIDFEAWPPHALAVAKLESMYGTVTLFPPDENLDGYAQFQVHGPVTYEAVTSVQRNASAAMKSFGGVCDSWGVMQDAP